jgi:hypothetical protein
VRKYRNILPLFLKADNGYFITHFQRLPPWLSDKAQNPSPLFFCPMLRSKQTIPEVISLLVQVTIPSVENLIGLPGAGRNGQSFTGNLYLNGSALFETIRKSPQLGHRLLNRIGLLNVTIPFPCHATLPPVPRTRLFRVLS